MHIHLLFKFSYWAERSSFASKIIASCSLCYVFNFVLDKLLNWTINWQKNMTIWSTLEIFTAPTAVVLKICRHLIPTFISFIILNLRLLIPHILKLPVSKKKNSSHAVPFSCIVGIVSYGPFMRLPRDIQELSVCCLYYFPFLDKELLQSLASCCICKYNSLALFVQAYFSGCSSLVSGKNYILK